MRNPPNSRMLGAIGLVLVVVATVLWLRIALAQNLAPPAATVPVPVSPNPPKTYDLGPMAPAYGPGLSPGGAAAPSAGPGAPAAMTGPAAGPGTAGASPPAMYETPQEAYARWWQDRPRLPQTEALRAEIDALIEQETYTRRLMSDYSRLEDDNERAAIVRELTRVIGKHFDIRQNVRERELERLEAQIRTLREIHQKRARLRDEIIQERVRQLLRDLDGLGWGADGLDLELRREPAAGGPMGRMGMPPGRSMAAPGSSMSTGGSGMMPPAMAGTTPNTMGSYSVIDPKQRALETSLNNLKQLGLAMHNYLDVNGSFAAPVVYGPDGKTPHSWRVALLPYLEQNDLYKQYNLNEPWDSENNLQLLDKMPAVFRDPSAPTKTIFASYYQISGLKPEPGRNAWKIFDVIDGTSNTLMIVEAKRNIPWTKPDDIPYVADRLPKFGGHHANVFLAAFYDGAAKKLPLKMPDAALRAIITPNGGEPIDASELGESTDLQRFPTGPGAPPSGLLPPTPGAPPALPAPKFAPNVNLPGSSGGGAPAVPAPSTPALPPGNKLNSQDEPQQKTPVVPPSNRLDLQDAPEGAT